jgi:hypothetical protein
MKQLALLVIVCGLSLSTMAQALTIDEIIKLKRAGVSDSTIEMLIKGDGDSRSAGTWKTKDGWIVHSTDTREQRVDYYDAGYSGYPIAVYPSYGFGRRHR